MATTNNGEPTEKEDKAENTTPSEKPAETDQLQSWKDNARKWEDRAKENLAQIEELTEATEETKAQIEDLTKQNAELQEKLTEAAKAKAKAETENLKLKVSNTTGVPIGLLHGNTEEELNAAAEEVLSFANSTQTHTPHVPNEGRSSGTPKPSELETLRAQLFETQD